MKYLYQFLIILAFTFLGELLSWIIPLPIPASVYGLILLFLALQCKLLKLKWVEETGNFLISIMPILFVAPVVNLLGSWELISPWLWQIAVIVILSTAVVFAAAGIVTQLLRKRRGDSQ